MSASQLAAAGAAVGLGSVQHEEAPHRLPAQLCGAQQRQLADAGLALHGQPLPRPEDPLHLVARTQPQRRRPDQARAAASAPRRRGARAAGRGPRPSSTCTTTPAGSPAPRTGRQYIRADTPVGSSTRIDPRCPAASASDACRSSAAWSAGSSCVRAWSFIITTSLFSAKTTPVVRRQVRRYSWNSSSCWAPASASSACRICSAVVLASVSSSDPASLRQQVRSTAPTVRPEIGWWIGTPAQASCLEVLGVVLVAEHVRRPADLERRADAVGADELLAVAEARRQQDPVEVPLEVVVGGQPAEHQPGRVGEDDADRLTVELLAEAAQHRLGRPGERAVEVGVADVRRARPGRPAPAGRGSVPTTRGSVPAPGRAGRRQR